MKHLHNVEGDTEFVEKVNLRKFCRKLQLVNSGFLLKMFKGDNGLLFLLLFLLFLNLGRTTF